MAEGTSGKRHYCTSCNNLMEQKQVYDEFTLESTPYGKLKTCVCVRCKLKELKYNSRGDQAPGSNSDLFEEWVLWNLVKGKEKKDLFSNEKKYVVLAKKLGVTLAGGSIFDNDDTIEAKKIIQEKHKRIKEVTNEK